MPAGRRFRPLALAALLAAGCQKATPAPAAGPPPAADAGPAVKVVAPKTQTLKWSVEQPGTVQPFEVTAVAAKLPGFVRRVLVDIGDAVAGPKFDAGGRVVVPGQLLAEIDIPEMVEEAAAKRAVAEQAAAEVEQAKRDLDVSDALIAVAESLVKEAEAGVPRAQADYDRWKSELARTEDLVTRKVIDPQNRDETLKQFRSAEASRQEAESKVATAKATLLQRRAMRERGVADVTTAGAKQKVADAEARRYAALAAYTEVRAPFAGTVTARNVHAGHLLQSAGGNRAEVLFTVARMDTVRVFVDVPEAAAAKAVPGAVAVVRVPALGGKEFAGTVTRTTGVIQPDSRTLRAEVDLPNPGGLLKPGAYAVVRIDAESADATVLPAACVLAADETHYCFLVEAGKAVKYRVQVGRADGGTVQVAARRKAGAVSGAWEPFAATDRVVVGNLGGLSDGVAVTVAKE